MNPDEEEYYALFGFPVSQSLSPLIHQIFAKNMNKSIHYKCIPTSLPRLQTEIDLFKMQGGKGANVTAPLKQKAFSLCKRRTLRAQEAQAVNTLFWQDDLLWGDNTDGEGLLNYLTKRLHLNLKDKRLLILGAGGTTQGILFPLLRSEVATIVIVNRDIDKAKALSLRDGRLHAQSYDHFNQSIEPPFELVINATSASLENKIPPLSSHYIQNTIVIDLAYQKNQETAFMQWAKDQGAIAVYDGIGMLVEQAALAFERWHQVLPETQAMIKILNGNLPIHCQYS